MRWGHLDSGKNCHSFPVFDVGHLHNGSKGICSWFYEFIVSYTHLNQQTVLQLKRLFFFLNGTLWLHMCN